MLMLVWCGGLFHLVRILDLCTGSGNIALALAKHLPNSTVRGKLRITSFFGLARSQHIGVDINSVALTLAEENRAANRVSQLQLCPRGRPCQ